VLGNVQDGERKFKMQQFMLFSKCPRERRETSSTYYSISLNLQNIQSSKNINLIY